MPLGGKQNGTVLKGHGIRGLRRYWEFAVHQKTREIMVARYSRAHGIRGAGIHFFLLYNISCPAIPLPRDFADSSLNDFNQ